MMRRLALFIVSFAALNAVAANNNAGTSGAPFLKLGAGARPAAMGDAFTAVSDDLNAVHYNPAGLANIERPEFLAGHTEWFQGMNYDFGAFAFATDFGAFALSAATLKVEDLQKRDTSEALQGTFEAMDAAYALTYSRNLGPLTSFGVSGRMIEQKLDTARGTAWAGDVGVMRRAARLPLRFGMSVRNAGQKIKLRSEADPLPTVFVAGVAANLWKERVLISVDGRVPRDNDVHAAAGIEVKRPGADLTLVMRGGYNGAATDADGSGLTFGGGIGFRNLSIDFAWAPFGDLGDTVRYSLLFRF